MSEKRKKTGGRKPGSLNRRTIVGKNVSETLKAWLGFDDESVARTGMIDGRGYGGRLKLEAMWNKGRPIDPQFIALGKFLFSYAYGNPGKMQMESGPQKSSVLFVTQHGYMPYDARANPEIDARSRAINLENDAKLQLEAAERAKPVVPEPESEGETLELLSPPPGESR